MNRKFLFVVVAALALSGCVSLDRQQNFVGGGALAGAVIGASLVTGAPGPTTAAVAGALVGGVAGYAVERFTRTAPPASAPSGR